MSLEIYCRSTAEMARLAREFADLYLPRTSPRLVSIFVGLLLRRVNLREVRTPADLEAQMLDGASSYAERAEALTDALPSGRDLLDLLDPASRRRARKGPEAIKHACAEACRAAAAMLQSTAWTHPLDRWAASPAMAR